VDSLPFLVDRIGWRRTRRILVVLLYGGMLSYAIAQAIMQTCQPAALAGHVLFGVLEAAIVAGTVSFFGLWRLRALHAVNATATQLDERLLLRRNYALAIAFCIVAIVCAFEFTAWQFRLIFTYPRGLDLASPFLFGDVALTLTLPIAILAWTEPDPPHDDDPGR